MDKSCDPRQISRLMDGDLDADELDAVLRSMDADDARHCWHLYHLIGDTLRAPELAACQRDDRFFMDLQGQLRQQPQEYAPRLGGLRSFGPAANEDRWRWKMVAGLASFVAVAAIGWGLMGVTGGPVPEATVVQAEEPAPVAHVLPTPVAQSAPQWPDGAEVLRDPVLDQLLAAHRQGVAPSAFGDMAGFLHTATAEGPAR